MSLGVLLSGKSKNDSGASTRKPQSTAFTLMTPEEESIILKEIDERFVDIGEALKTVNECILTLNDRLTACESTLSAIVEAHNHLQTVDRVTYRPPGSEEHISVKDNLDLIYERLSKLENNN